MPDHQGWNIVYGHEDERRTYDCILRKTKICNLPFPIKNKNPPELKLLMFRGKSFQQYACLFLHEMDCYGCSR